MMRKFLILTSAAIMVASMAPDALAQRDSASKARGDMGGFWTAGKTQANTRASVGFRTAAQPVVESYRSFSYVPAPAPSAMKPGDAAVVRVDNTKMMSGSDVVAPVPRGTAFTVTKVINGWLGAVVEIDGKKSSGWIWNANAARQNSAAPTVAVQQPAGIVQVPAQPAQTEVVQEYRSFSYEPAPATSRYTQPTKKRPWEYPKTDPRRYNP